MSRIGATSCCRTAQPAVVAAEWSRRRAVVVPFGEQLGGGAAAGKETAHDILAQGSLSLGSPPCYARSINPHRCPD